MNKSHSLPLDDLTRPLTIVSPEAQNVSRVALVGDTYSILLTGKDTANRYCLIHMYVPSGGGPPLHRHDFEESFTVLSGEIEMTFRGETVKLRAGQTAHIPTNAPHRFQNVSNAPAYLYCVCSPAGQDEFFKEVGIPVSSATSSNLDPHALEAIGAKIKELAPKYRTEIME